MIPHPVAGYTYLGVYTYSTYSTIFYIYRNNKTNELYEAVTGSAPWIPNLIKIEDKDIKLFSPKIQ